MNSNIKFFPMNPLSTFCYVLYPSCSCWPVFANWTMGPSPRMSECKMNDGYPAQCLQLIVELSRDMSEYALVALNCYPHPQSVSYKTVP